MTQVDEIGIAHMIRDYVQERGETRILMRDIRRHLRAQGLVYFIEWKLWDAIKEMYDAGWIKEADYLHNYIVFDESLVSGKAA